MKGAGGYGQDLYVKRTCENTDCLPSDVTSRRRRENP